VIVVDGSVWIDFLSGRNAPHVRQLRVILGAHEIALGDLMLCEPPYLQNYKPPKIGLPAWLKSWQAGSGSTSGAPAVAKAIPNVDDWKCGSEWKGRQGKTITHASSEKILIRQANTAQTIRDARPLSTGSTAAEGTRLGKGAACAIASASFSSPPSISLLTGKLIGNFANLAPAA
jgi:hypothetical protein